MMRRYKYSYFELKFSLQVIGKTNKILQGPETNKLQAHDMVKTLRSGEQEAHIQIYNYKASGQGFWNDLYVYGYVHENDLEGALPDYHVAFLREMPSQNLMATDEKKILSQRTKEIIELKRLMSQCQLKGTLSFGMRAGTMIIG